MKKFLADHGAAVAVTARVPGGKRFTGWTVNEGGVTLDNASSATTTFTMPARAVTVTANFKSIPSGGGSSGGSSGGGSAFDDVDSGAWCAGAITWAAAQGIVGGYGDGMFGPNDPITREQLAVMLWRYAGSPVATNKELHFNDTDEISGYALNALRWAVENGVLNGYGDGRLGPKGQATRAQAAQMLTNFLKNQ